jgi:hypothetical protein
MAGGGGDRGGVVARGVCGAAAAAAAAFTVATAAAAAASVIASYTSKHAPASWQRGERKRRRPRIAAQQQHAPLLWLPLLLLPRSCQGSPRVPEAQHGKLTPN